MNKYISDEKAKMKALETIQEAAASSNDPAAATALMTMAVGDAMQANKVESTVDGVTADFTSISCRGNAVLLGLVVKNINIVWDVGLYLYPKSFDCG